MIERQEKHELVVEVERLQDIIDRQLGNCIGCTTEPDETCPRDGRTYTEWVEIASSAIRRENELRNRLAEVTAQRDQAIAHDRQPYPTAWAYEEACRAASEAKAERDALAARLADAERERDEARYEVERLRSRINYWMQLEQQMVARLAAVRVLLPQWQLEAQVGARMNQPGILIAIDQLSAVLDPE